MMKDIEGYPGYKINENGIVINKRGHVLRPALSNVGRPRVALETYDENGKLISRDNHSIYRLAAKAFLPNPDNLPLVMHLDNDPLHNHISNLKWGTASENMRQSFDDGLVVNNHKTCKNVYEVYNEDRSDVIKCKGTEGVAELLEYTTAKSVRPGIIKSGKYEGYTIENTHIKIKQPLIFDKRFNNDK